MELDPAIVARMTYLLTEHRRLARLARQFKFMRQSAGHELLSIRAAAAHQLVMIDVETLAKQLTRART